MRNYAFHAFIPGMTKHFSARVKKALKLLKDSQQREAVVISSNPHMVRSRDTHFPYRTNSDLFYFTGSHIEDITLVLRPHSKDPVVLLVRPEDKVKTVWDGPQPSVRPLASMLKAEVVTSTDHLKSLLNLVRGYDVAYLQSIPGTASAALKSEIASRSSYANRGLPQSLIEVERFTARLRAFKDREEITRIQEAAALTGDALLHVFPLLQSGSTEHEIGAFIDYFYRANGAEPAFGTIVAAGKSAATLHYRALTRKLREGEFVLIDTGCELNMYAADVTRTIPVGESLAPQLLDLYDIVLRAQLCAIKKVRSGAAIKDVFDVAARELTVGLKYLGILKGSLPQLMKKQAYRPYFPHGIGHSLGIDVHDASPGINDKIERLEAGMVITIEPGLYFSKPVGPLPACGVRIEDDVLVTTKGAEVLTAGVFPKGMQSLLEIGRSAAAAA